MQSAEEILKTYNLPKAISFKAIDKAKDKAIAIAIEGINTDLKPKTVKTKAEQLMEKVGANRQWIRFYCKCIHKLTDYQINYILEGALLADSPDRYFAAAARAELEEASSS